MKHLKKIKVNEPNDVEVSEPYNSVPNFYINAEQMPEIEDWQVGEKYQIVMEVEQKSKEINENNTSARFDIVAYRYLPKKSIDEMTDDEFGEYQSTSLDKGKLQ